MEVIFVVFWREGYFLHKLIFQVSLQSQTPDSTWGSGGPNPLAKSHTSPCLLKKIGRPCSGKLNAVVQQRRLGTTGLCEKQDNISPPAPIHTKAYLLTVLIGMDGYALQM